MTGMVYEAIKNTTRRSCAVPPLLRVLVTLRFLAGGTFYYNVGDLSGIHKCTICRAVKRVCHALVNLSEINAQVCCGTDNLIYQATVKWPGSCRIFDNSTLDIMMEGNRHLGLNRVDGLLRCYTGTRTTTA